MREAAYSVAVRALQGEFLETLVGAEAVHSRHLAPGTVRTEFPSEDVVC
jgi:hypothetical protein